MDPVGAQLGQQPGVVGDGQDPHGGLGGGRLHPAGHGPQGVHVQTGVDLVENGELGCEHCHLHRLVALALAAGEVHVEGSVYDGLVEADAARLLADGGGHPGRLLPRRLQGGRQGVDQGHTRHLYGILHAEEQPRLGPSPRGQGQEVLPVEGHLAPRDLVARAPEQHVRQGALARAVGSHDDVHLARAGHQVDAAEDLVTAHRRPQAGHHQLAHLTVTTTSSPSTRTW